MNNFNIEIAFKEYLKLVGLDIETISQLQLQETKRAFFGGCGYMFRALERTSDMPTEEEAIFTFKSLENQIEEFFKVEVIQQSKINTDEV